MTNHQTICAILHRTGKLFNKNQMPSDETVEIYAEALEEYGADQVAKAVKQLIRNGIKFFPSCPEIIGKMNPYVEPTNETKNDFISGEIISSIRRFGSYRAIDACNHLGPTAWKAVAYVGGWDVICSTDESQLGMLRAQLKKAVNGSIAGIENQKLVDYSEIGKKLDFSKQDLIE